MLKGRHSPMCLSVSSKCHLDEPNRGGASQPILDEKCDIGVRQSTVQRVMISPLYLTQWRHKIKIEYIMVENFCRRWLSHIGQMAAANREDPG